MNKKNTTKKAWAKAWQGRFDEKNHPVLESFNQSLSVDYRLYKQDIEGSQVHAAMLQKIGILTTKELQKITRGLGRIESELDAGQWHLYQGHEDIHMAVEARLTQLIGPLGGKLHTGRSRNDQVALDVRLYVRHELESLGNELVLFLNTLIQRAETDLDVIVPGYTHLQRAQPIILAHYWLAYAEMFFRDLARLVDATERLNECPLGAGALAGSTLPLDREFVARQLGFHRPTRNSLDSVASRDYQIESIFAVTLMLQHFSRLAEEMVLWSSQEFGFITLPQAFCTGSSMMPQKINPDVPELVRGKASRSLGNLVTALSLIKNLPLAYNKDLQEDKRPLFDTLDTAHEVLQIMSLMLPGIQVHKSTMKQATHHGFLLATDLAEYLVQKGLPFREAHEVIGSLVRYCQKNGTILEELSLAKLQEFSPLFSKDVAVWLSVENSVARRNSLGGTSPSRIKNELRQWKKVLKDVA
jgi:argininosuccinate lyase